MSQIATNAASVETAAEVEAPVLRIRNSVSVVIVTYFTGPLLWRCLRSVLDQPGIQDVVVVDNGNWPKTISDLVDMAVVDPRLKVITGQGNVGFAVGCNLGVDVAEGNEILLLNPDTVMPAGAIQGLREEGVRKGGSGHWMIGGRLINADGSEQAGARRGPLTPWTAFVEMTRIDKLAPRHPYFRRFNNHEDTRPDGTIPIPCISGACMLLPKASYLALGGMDEGYFLHAEDIDFCLRFRNFGGDVFFHPGVDILHMKSSSRAERIRVEKCKAKSLNRYFRRHYKSVYPVGFVGLVCGLVWAGWGLRAAKIMAQRGASLIGFNRRHGLSRAGRAARVSRRMGSH